MSQAQHHAKRERLASWEVQRIEQMLAKRKAKVADAERKLAEARKRLKSAT